MFCFVVGLRCLEGRKIFRSVIYWFWVGNLDLQLQVGENYSPYSECLAVVNPTVIIWESPTHILE